jgi:hypothetical protein
MENLKTRITKLEQSNKADFSVIFLDLGNDESKEAFRERIKKVESENPAAHIISFWPAE